MAPVLGTGKARRRNSAPGPGAGGLSRQFLPQRSSAQAKPTVHSSIGSRGGVVRKTNGEVVVVDGFERFYGISEQHSVAPARREAAAPEPRDGFEIFYDIKSTTGKTEERTAVKENPIRPSSPRTPEQENDEALASTLIDEECSPGPASPVRLEVPTFSLATPANSFLPPKECGNDAVRPDLSSHSAALAELRNQLHTGLQVPCGVSTYSMATPAASFLPPKVSVAQQEPVLEEGEDKSPSKTEQPLENAPPVVMEASSVSVVEASPATITQRRQQRLPRRSAPGTTATVHRAVATVAEKASNVWNGAMSLTGYPVHTGPTRFTISSSSYPQTVIRNEAPRGTPARTVVSSTVHTGSSYWGSVQTMPRSATYD